MMRFASPNPSLLAGLPGRHDGDNRYTREQRLLFWAMVISMALHIVVGLMVGDTPLGRIDPSLLAESQEQFRIRRVDRDQIFEDETREFLASQGDAVAAEQTTLAALSETLLQEQDAPAGLPSEITDPKVALRELPEQRLQELIRELAVTMPKVELPETVQQRVTPHLEIEVKHMPMAESGGAGGANVTAAELSAAQRMLAESRLMVGNNPVPQVARRPIVQDMRGVGGDQRVLDAPMGTPSIDFAKIALADSSRLTVPEHLDDDFDYVLSKFVPGRRTGGLFGLGAADDGDTRGYFRLDITPKRSLRRLQTMPKDVVVLIDISGSIPQTWVNQMVRGVSDGLNSLNPEDRFNIVFFHDSPQFFAADQIQPVNEQTLRQAREFLTGRKSGGYTDVNRALSRLLTRDVAVDRVYNLILISDGLPTKGVLDTRELINLITRDNDLNASIYCVGVGAQQNRELLDFLAYRNKGFSVFAGLNSDAAQAIRDLMSRLRYPIMKDIALSIIGLDADEVFPRDLPNIHQNESFSIYGRYGEERPFTMRMIGHNGRGLLDFTVKRDLAEALGGDENIADRWAFTKLHHLYNEMIIQGETKDLRAAIEFLRRKYGLKTLY